MSRELERQAVFSLIQGLLPPEAGPIAWPNTPFQVPTASRWCAIELLTGSSVRVSIGKSYLKRTTSILQVDLFIPADLGTAPLQTTADFLEFVLDMKQITLADGDTIEFETPYTKQIALNEIRASNLEDNWYRLVVTAPLYRDSHVQK